MPIADLQRRLTQIGVIRLGNKVATGGTDRNGNPKFRPAKLDTFRMTSPSQTLIEAVAEAYGGTVQPWVGPSGPEFEVVTTVRELPVLVPPQTIDPNYEAWGPGFRSRLCDGIRERLRNEPCLCRRGGGGHVHDFVAGTCECGATRDCKPTVRVSVMLRKIPSIGTWKVESHGINAAAEGLTSAAEAIAASPVPLPARLTMKFVDKKTLSNPGQANEKLEARKFWVPQLIIDWLTPEQAYGGQIEAAARQMLAVSAGPERPALEASATVAPEVVADLYRRAEAATSVDDLMAVWDAAREAGAIDAGMKEMFAKRGAELKAAAAPVAEVEQAPAATPAVAEQKPIDGEVEPNQDETWAAILREAGKHGWKTSQVENRYRAQMGHDPSDGNGWQLAEFLKALTDGQVAA